jgi:hypothetical protein
VAPGELLPCGSSPDGRHREFFAHETDVPSLLADGILITLDGVPQRFRVALSPTPHYGNGDVQVVAHQL